LREDGCRSIPEFEVLSVASVGSEKPFSADKVTLGEKRHGFKSENIENIPVIYCADNCGQGGGACDFQLLLFSLYHCSSSGLIPLVILY
jgi:hypothetical protein